MNCGHFQYQIQTVRNSVILDFLIGSRVWVIVICRPSLSWVVMARTVAARVITGMLRGRQPASQLARQTRTHCTYVCLCVHIYIYIYIYPYYTKCYTHTHTHICIYDPGSRFADPPPPQWYPPPPPTLPKPNLCDCAHVFHMRAPKATTVTRIASQDARSV